MSRYWASKDNARNKQNLLPRWMKTIRPRNQTFFLNLYISSKKYSKFKSCLNLLFVERHLYPSASGWTCWFLSSRFGVQSSLTYWHEFNYRTQSVTFSKCSLLLRYAFFTVLIFVYNLVSFKVSLYRSSYKVGPRFYNSHITYFIVLTCLPYHYKWKTIINIRFKSKHYSTNMLYRLSLTVSKAKVIDQLSAKLLPKRRWMALGSS